MKIFKVGMEEYEIYLSSNGVIRIEQEMQCGLQELDMKKIGFKAMMVLLYGILWQRNKLSLERVTDLFDEWIESNEMSELGVIIKNEIQLWSSKMKKKSNSNNEDKKK